MNLYILADRCETAADAFLGDSELTADIYEALGYEVIRRPRGRNGIAWKYRGNGPLYNNLRWISMQHLTGKVDDAMGLLPDNAQWSLTGGGATFRVTIGNHSGIGCTPALALCAAALRAQAATLLGDNGTSTEPPTNSERT
jgi:hypothetical protein